MIKLYKNKKQIEYKDIAREILKLNPRVIALKGPLGAGKTTFVKYIAKEMGIDKIVSSPTFNIIKEYDNILCHVDDYRVCQEDIVIDYYYENKYLICIEWYENIIDYLPKIDIILSIEYNGDGRNIILEYNEKS